MKKNIKQTVEKNPLTHFTKAGILTVLFLTFFASQFSIANTNYVGTAGTPGGNYFTDIQSAVDATLENGLVLVSNGVYNIVETVSPYGSASNRVLILKYDSSQYKRSAIDINCRYARDRRRVWNRRGPMCLYGSRNDFRIYIIEWICFELRKSVS